MKKRIIAVVVLIVLCNVPPIKWIFTWFDHDDYRYSNYNASFTFEEFQFKNRDFDMGYGGFAYFKQNCNCADTILYRLNRNNPLKFWRYSDYLFKKKYQLPYLSWNKIKNKRDTTDYHGVQDF